MIRAVVILIIAGVAGLMGWLFFAGECREGQIVTGAEQCRGAGFGAELCAVILARWPQEAARGGNVFPNRAACEAVHLQCLEHAGTMGYTPRPRGFCVVGSSPGTLRMTPVYAPPRTAS
jgi:hypothetical protein